MKGLIASIVGLLVILFVVAVLNTQSLSTGPPLPSDVIAILDTQDDLNVSLSAYTYEIHAHNPQALFATYPGDFSRRPATRESRADFLINLKDGDFNPRYIGKFKESPVKGFS